MSTIGVHGGGSSTSISEPVLVSGSDDGGTTERVLHTDAAGDLQVDVASVGSINSTVIVAEIGRQATGTLSSLGGTVDLTLDQGAGVAAFNVEDTGSFLGTIIVVGVVDGVLRPISQYYNATDHTVDTAIAMGKIYWVPCGGLETISLYVSAYTSGSADGAIGAGPGTINMPKGTQAISAASLPLPSGASTLAEQQTQTTHLSNIAASASVMDDWDESDRAKVNLIVGQAGITAGAGSVAANTPRVTHASDDPVTTSVQLIDDIVHSGDAALSKYAVIGAVFDDAATATVTENNAISLRMTSGRALHVAVQNTVAIGDGTNPITVVTDGADNLANTNNELVTAGLNYAFDGANWDRVPNGGGVEAAAMRVTIASDSTGVLSVDDNGSSLTVDGTVTIGDGTNNVVVVTDGADNLANTNNELVTAALNYAFDGTNWDRVTNNGGTEATALRVTIANDSTGLVSVDDNGGSLTVDGAVTVTGNIAHDSPDSGNPVKIGGFAQLNERTAVADADRVDAWFDQIGRMVVLLGHANPEPPVTVNATSSGNTTVIAAPGAGSLYIQKASVHNRAAANRLVALTDGAGGTTRWRAELIAEGGGSLIDFGARGWKLTATTALVVNLDSAGDVDVNITEYYIAA